MGWRKFPDKEYVPDHSSEFLKSSGLRRRVLAFELATGCAQFGLICVIMFSFFMLIENWAIVVPVIVVGSIGVMVIFDKFRPMGKGPLKCSVCSKRMVKVSGGKDAPGAVFYACLGCKRYVDTGITDE